MITNLLKFATLCLKSCQNSEGEGSSTGTGENCQSGNIKRTGYVVAVAKVFDVL